MIDVRHLLSLHLGASMARQLAFAEDLANYQPGLNAEELTLSLAMDESPLALVPLGTVLRDDTWIWAWSLPQYSSNKRCQRLAQRLQTWSSDNQLSTFLLPSLPLELADGHQLAMLALCALDKYVYYCCPVGNELQFYIVRNYSRKISTLPVDRLVTVINEAVERFDVDHQTLVTSMLQDQGYTTEWHDRLALNAFAKDGRQVTVMFTIDGQIDFIEGEGTPRQRFWQKRSFST